MNSASPRPGPTRPSLAVTLLLAAAPAAAWAALLAFLCLSVPAYERVFADFRLRLPDTAVAVIDASRWSIQYLPLVLPALALLCAADVGVLLLLRRGSGTRLLAWLWSALLLLLPLAALACGWLAVRQPYAKLLEGLGGGK
jgi:type II secretory pathway component PulF